MHQDEARSGTNMYVVFNIDRVCANFILEEMLKAGRQVRGLVSQTKEF